MNKHFEVSALVVCYKPNLKKLIMTLKSFIYQKDVCMQIVISDDGSEIDHFDEIKAFFAEYKFKDYVLVKNTKNVGTVQNCISGIEKCVGTYIKGISPGDYLAEENALRKWLDYMKSNNLSVCGGDYYCYHFNDEGKVEYTKALLHPRITGLKDFSLRLDYLINNDLFLGAAILCDRELFLKYLRMIENKVVYAEDNTYRLMAYCGEKIGFFNQKTVIYEVGTGISTCNDSKWQSLIRKDWETTDIIMLNMPTKDLKLQLIFKKFNKLNKIEGKSKYFFYLKIRGLFLLKLKAKISSRISSRKLPVEWIKKIGGDVA